MPFPWSAGAKLAPTSEQIRDSWNERTTPLVRLYPLRRMTIAIAAMLGTGLEMLHIRKKSEGPMIITRVEQVVHGLFRSNNASMLVFRIVQSPRSWPDRTTSRVPVRIELGLEFRKGRSVKTGTTARSIRTLASFVTAIPYRLSRKDSPRHQGFPQIVMVAPYEVRGSGYPVELREQGALGEDAGARGSINPSGGAVNATVYRDNMTEVTAPRLDRWSCVAHLDATTGSSNTNALMIHLNGGDAAGGGPVRDYQFAVVVTNFSGVLEAVLRVRAAMGNRIHDLKSQPYSMSKPALFSRDEHSTTPAARGFPANFEEWGENEFMAMLKLPRGATEVDLIYKE